MSSVQVIVGKEIRELVRGWKSLLFGLFFAMIFSLSYALNPAGTEIASATASLDGSIYFLTVATAFFSTYTAANQVFLHEKSARVIETLLCAPISLRAIWLGKAIAVGTVSYVLCLSVAIVLIAGTGITQGFLVLPSLPIAVDLLVALPTFILAFGGLLGFVQFLMGMRENRIMNFAAFAPFFGIFIVGTLLGGRISMWIYVLVLFALSALILAATTFMARYLSKERIITTIP
jgi:ABC-2 type transport system permease protein